MTVSRHTRVRLVHIIIADFRMYVRWHEWIDVHHGVIVEHLLLVLMSLHRLLFHGLINIEFYTRDQVTRKNYLLDSEKVRALLICLFCSLVRLELFSSLAEILPKLGIGVASDSTWSLVLDYAPSVPL